MREDVNNIIRISNIPGISLKEASIILGLKYHNARNKLNSCPEIGRFDYDGTVLYVEEDVRRYKANHFKPAKGA